MADSWIAFPRQRRAGFAPGACRPARRHLRARARQGRLLTARSTQMYHRHPPTGWTPLEGPLAAARFRYGHARSSRPPSPWERDAAARPTRRWSCGSGACEGAMDHLARNGDGDELLFVHAGAGELYCDYGHLAVREGDYVMLPRGTLWRIETHGARRAAADRGDRRQLPAPRERASSASTRCSIPAVLDAPAIDDAFRAQQARARDGGSCIKRARRVEPPYLPFNPLDAVGWHGTLMPVRLNWRDIRPADEPPLCTCRPRRTRRSSPSASSSARSARARSRAIPAR